MRPWIGVVVGLAALTSLTGCAVRFFNAVSEGDTPTVLRCLEGGSRASATIPIVGTTALMVAAGNGHVETVRILLDWGANPNATDLSGWTALHAAAYRGDPAILQLLLDRGAHLPAARWYLKTPRRWAEDADHPEAAKVLEEAERAALRPEVGLSRMLEAQRCIGGFREHACGLPPATGGAQPPFFSTDKRSKAKT